MTGKEIFAMLDEIILADKEKPFKFNQHGGDDVRCTPPIDFKIFAFLFRLLDTRYEVFNKLSNSSNTSKCSSSDF